MSTQDAAPATDTADESAAPNAQDVTLTSSRIQSITYRDGSLDITDGQPANPPPAISRNGSTWKISLDAGQSLSKSVATRFVQRSGGSETNLYAPFRGGGTPEELYFSYGVRITFAVGSKSVPVDVYLAQGRSIARNNWWIGGNAVENVGEPLLELIENNKIIDTFKMSGGVSSFEFREV